MAATTATHDRAGTPASAKEAITFRLPKDLYEQMKALAFLQDQPMVGVVIDALEAFFAAQGPKFAEYVGELERMTQDHRRRVGV